MKLFIVARHKEVIPTYKKEIKKAGFKYGKRNADIILSLGGDGTYLIAEHRYPGVPKLLIRDSRVCNKCSIRHFNTFLNMLQSKKTFKIERTPKLEGHYKKDILIATNDIVIRNKNQQQAIRFELKVNNKKIISKELIGDGAVFSTPWGSTAYYHSITGKSFEKGLGIALNHIRSFKRRNILVDEKAKIEFKLIRGDAYITHDNYKKKFLMKTGDKIDVKSHKNPAKIVKLIK